MLQEKIVKLSNEITNIDHSVLLIMFDEIMNELSYESIFTDSSKPTVQRLNCLRYICKMIVHTRDIIEGKGERDVTWILLYKFYEYYPRLAESIFCSFVTSNGNTHPYGSWRDIKYFCNYILTESQSQEHPFIQFICELCANQYVCDMALYKEIHSATGSNKQLSLFARWMPRESSNRFGWFFRLLAESTHRCYFKSTDTTIRNNGAKRKAYMNLRKNLAKMNKQLDTTQIHQCSGEYSKIDYHNVTSKTMHLQQLAFMNKTKEQGVRCPDNDDRKQAAENFEKYINFEHISNASFTKKSESTSVNNQRQSLDRYLDVDNRFNVWFVDYIGGLKSM
jgi:hypothetical protein